MTRLARLSVLYASLLVLAALLIGGGYYLYYRPMFPPPEKQAAIERFIKDPGSPVEQIRKVALEGHDVAVAGFKAMDAAILMIVIVCLIAAVGFISIAITARKAKVDAPSAL
jgi:predicted permease